VDTEGQVDRFYKRLQAREDYLQGIEERAAERTSPELPIVELELGTRPEGTLSKAGIETVGQAIELLQEGDAALLAIDGFGRKSLAVLKRALRKRGIQLPEEALEMETT
jgi:large subunit ribosomal protein L31